MTDRHGTYKYVHGIRWDMRAARRGVGRAGMHKTYFGCRHTPLPLEFWGTLGRLAPECFDPPVKLCIGIKNMSGLHDLVGRYTKICRMHKHRGKSHIYNRHADIPIAKRKSIERLPSRPR